MNEDLSRRELRAVVLSGGGAKGIFESGSIHALYQTGFEPDVITGSSVGAINAVAFAEVVRERRANGPEAARNTMNKTLTLWQRLDRHRVADFDRWGWRPFLFTLVALGFAFFFLSWAILGSALPGNWGIAQRVIAALCGVVLAVKGVWALVAWFRLPGWMSGHVQEGMDAGLERAPDAEISQQPKESSSILQKIATGLGLHPFLFKNRGLARALGTVVPKNRRLSEYRLAGVDVRLTRTNIRTGRTELSEYMTLRDLEHPGMKRGQRVLGDPYVIPAALASSAFPVAFPPVFASAIYPPSENPELYVRITERSQAKKLLKKIFGTRAKQEYLWLMSTLDAMEEAEPSLLKVGREQALARQLTTHFVGGHVDWTRLSLHFISVLIDTRHWPQLPLPEVSTYCDRYFDGGILDNTPLSPALAGIRETMARRLDGRDPEPADEDLGHEAVVVLLSPRPRRRYVSAQAAAALDGPALGARALRLQAEKRLIDDVKMAEKIDRILMKREAEKDRRETRSASPVLSGVSDAGTGKGGNPDPHSEATGGGGWHEVLGHKKGGTTGGSGTDLDPIGSRLVPVRVTRVYPTWDLPWVLALDDRLGFSAKQARSFQVRGCRDTLDALRGRFRQAKQEGREPQPHESRAARLVGGENSAMTLQRGWSCRSEECSLRKVCDNIAAEERTSVQEQNSVPIA